MLTSRQTFEVEPAGFLYFDGNFFVIIPIRRPKTGHVKDDVVEHLMGVSETCSYEAREVKRNKTMSMDLISRLLSDSSIKNEPAMEPISSPRLDIFSQGRVQKAWRKIDLEIGSPTILVVEPADICHRY